MIDLMKVPWGHHILLIGKCKKAVDKLGVVVDETFMESELSPKHDTARNGKVVSNG